jgi:hypothetical protein
MLPPFRIIRPSNTLKGFQEKLLEQAWAALATAHRTLADNPHPDTFAGRKTQEPFPSEEDL